MDKSERFWDKVSKKSAKGTSKLEEINDIVVEKIVRHLRVSDVVLDYGCGSGVITNDIALNVNKVDAIDISSGMIEVAKSNTDMRKIDNVTFTQTDIFNLEISENLYDVILAINVLPYVDDQQMVFERVYDLLKPGGLFISATGCLGERMSLLSLLVPVVSKIGLMPKFKLFSTEQLKHAIASCSFEIVESENLSRLPDCFIVAKKAIET